MSNLQEIIEKAFEDRANINPKSASAEVRDAVAETINSIDSGNIRVSEKISGECVNHQWIKKAVLLSFRLSDNEVIRDGYTNYFDKVDSKFSGYGQSDFDKGGFRVVPPAAVRKGSFIAKNVVLMPSYVNIGAYVDEGTMVDTWATVGSCAQIGKNVHLSGGVGIGGVLEPLQANPTIIEDNCFIGARSEIVEGVIVGEDRSYRWASTSVKVQKFMIDQPVKSHTEKYRLVRWWFLVTCHQKMERTASTARS